MDGVGRMELALFDGVLDLILVAIGKCCWAESAEEVFVGPTRSEHELAKVFLEVGWWYPTLETVVLVGKLIEEFLDDCFFIVGGC